MKQIIDNVEVYILTGPAEKRPHWVSHFIVPTANELLVKIKTKQGSFEYPSNNYLSNWTYWFIYLLDN